LKLNKPDTLSKFYFNPFSGIEWNNVEHIIVAQVDTNDIQEIFDSEKSLHIEFLGRQGRGKTTHLHWIANKLNNIPLYQLTAESNLEELYEDKSEVLLIDSVHHIPIHKRIGLFKSKKTILFTTHWTRKFECILVGKPLKTIRFKGINPQKLDLIINKRLLIARKEGMKNIAEITQQEIKDLIIRHKDNYRGIINELYDRYQL